MIFEGPWYAQFFKGIGALVLIGGFVWLGPWKCGKKLPKWLKSR